MNTDTLTETQWRQIADDAIKAALETNVCTQRLMVLSDYSATHYANEAPARIAFAKAAVEAFLKLQPKPPPFVEFAKMLTDPPQPPSPPIPEGYRPITDAERLCVPMGAKIWSRTYKDWDKSSNIGKRAHPESPYCVPITTPAPRMVPLEASDLKPGDVMRRIACPEEWELVGGVEKHGLRTSSCYMDYADIADRYEISRDGGKTWTRAEKEERAS